MSKIITKFIQKQHQPESGFTLMEVIVAALMVFLFVVGSMQALALSTALRVKAQQRQRSNQLIQEDIEQIRLAAENMPVNHSLCSATGYSGSYAQALTTSADFPANYATKNLIEGNTDSKLYKLYRTTDTANSTNTVLKLKYEVKDEEQSKVVATDYVEVIPDAAIQCP